jgi:hypothetical protein
MQLRALGDLGVCATETVPLDPVVIDNCDALNAAEKAAIVARYNSSHGVAYFVIANSPLSRPEHPLLRIADQLRQELDLRHPLVHPLENHPDLVSRFGSDGTLKVCDTGKRSEAGYREQGETAENFHI